MHILAKLSERTDRDTGEVYLGGNFKLGTIKAQIRLVEADAKRSKGSPSHRVEIFRSGEWHNFGIAWKQAPHGGGEDYFSVKLSHPMWLRYEMQVAAFPPSEDADDGEWQLVWKPPVARLAADPLASDAVMF